MAVLASFFCAFVAQPRTALAADLTRRAAVVFLADGVSFEQLLSIPQVRGLGQLGGAGLLSARTPLSEAIAALREPISSGQTGGSYPLIVELGEAATGQRSPPAGRLRRIGAKIGRALDEIQASDELVIVATPSQSNEMERAKDELTGIVMAHGSPDAVASTIGNPSRGELTSITSDSTRRDGVVTSMDVAATVEAYLGRPASGGATIRLDPSPAPFDLHARYLADRRLSVPVQTGAGIYVTLVGLFGAVVVVRKSPVPAWARRVAALGAMSLFPLAAFLLLVGHASTLSYTSVVVVIVAGVSASLVAIDRIAAVGGPVVAAGAVGLAVLALFAIEAALGWTAALTPLLGGSELDGGRFYGLPNVDIGLLLGAAVLFAAWIQRPLIGAAAVGAVGLFAGLPWTGSNLGGAVTLFAAAGLWYGTCRTGRLGLRSIGGAAVAATVGTIVVLAAHRYLSTFPTHIGEFLRGESGGLLAKVADRIAVGIDLIGRNPFALVPVLGVVACAAVVLRPPPKLASAFGTGPVWHAAVITILAASVVAYVANDSGPAALGLGFGSAVATVIWASLAERGRKGSERLG